MSQDHHWKAVAFAERIATAQAEVHLVHADKGRWTACSTGPAGEISLPAPESETWPRLEGLMRVLAGVGLFRARLKFRGVDPVFANDSTAASSSAQAASALAQYAKVMAFAQRARVPGAKVDLELGDDGLWYVFATLPFDRHALTPVCGDGWGRLDGLLQVLAGAGLSEADVTFRGIPPKRLGDGGA